MKITLYTVETCKFSAEEKEYFKSKNLPFEEKDVEKDHAALEQMLKAGNNFAGTPVTEIVKDDGTTVVLKGFTQEEFENELFPKPKEEAKPAESEKAAEGEKPADAAAQTTDPGAPPADPNAPEDPNAPPSQTPPPAAAGTPASPDAVPADPNEPPAPGAPAATPAGNPLDSILQDLQSKIPPPTMDTPPAPQTPPGAPPPPAGPPQAPPAPPQMPPAPQTPIDPGQPTVPDFPKQ